MGRVLFVVPPLHGHVNPTVALGAELTSRGHEVAWCGYRELVEGLLPAGSEMIAVGSAIPAGIIETVRSKSQGLRGGLALEFLWKDFLCPLARAMVPGVEAAVDSFGPDLLVVDQQALAGAVVGRRRKMLWATSATTSAELVDPFRMLPKVGEWVRQRLADLERELGVDSGAGDDLRFSPHLVLAFTTEALAGKPVLPEGAGPVAFVGPSLPAARPLPDGAPLPDGGRDPTFPWEWLDGEGPRLLVSLGTVNMSAGGRFFATAVEALAAGGRLDSSGARALLVADPEMFESLPGNVLVRPSVPQVELLGRMGAVVCHGGHNTVCEALSMGIPLVVAPIRDDQPIIAEQVTAAGAGVRVRFARVRPAELAEAIEAALFDPELRAGAARVQASFAAAGGAPGAADRLEQLLGVPERAREALLVPGGRARPPARG